MIPIIILASIVGIIYANFGIKIGIDVSKELRESNKQVRPGDEIFVGLLAGAIWPLLLVTLASRQRKNKMLQETPAKMLPWPKNQDSPVDVAEAVLALEGKRAQLEREVSQLGQQIEELKADPEVSKVLKFPKRF